MTAQLLAAADAVCNAVLNAVTDEREDVVVEFTELHKKNQRTPIPLWMEKNAGHIPWVKEEYDRVKSGKLATVAGDIPHQK